jgi:hypothetical protein
VNATVPGTSVTVQWWDDSFRSIEAYRAPRLRALIFVGFAGLALVMATLGIFGNVLFLPDARRQEMAIRMAVGATAQLLTFGLVQWVAGSLIVGLAIGALGTYWMKQLLQGSLLIQIDSAYG